MKLPNLTNSMVVAEWRHIQSVHETTELRNPDTYVRHFLPVLRRWQCTWLGQKKLSLLRSYPFYYYLVARTRYYDGVFIDAIRDNIQNIINVGCGSDTRSYRFEHLLKQKGIKVLECDQPEAISAKRRMVERRRALDYVTYVSIDLNNDAWPELEDWLDENNRAKALVLMEGVSPYVNDEAFDRFLKLLATKLSAGSRVAYDYKLRGVADDFGRVGRTERPFRLSAVREEVGIYHEERGYRLDHMELSSDLSARLLNGLAKSLAPSFKEDGLVLLEVAHRYPDSRHGE